MAEFMTALTHQKSVNAKEVDFTFERETFVKDKHQHKQALLSSTSPSSHGGVGTASDTNVVDIAAIVEAFAKAIKARKPFITAEKSAWSEFLSRGGRLTISLAEFTAATNAAENTIPKT
jgi:hypothetical protein